MNLQNHQELLDKEKQELKYIWSQINEFKIYKNQLNKLSQNNQNTSKLMQQISFLKSDIQFLKAQLSQIKQNKIIQFKENENFMKKITKRSQQRHEEKDRQAEIIKKVENFEHIIDNFKKQKQNELNDIRRQSVILQEQIQENNERIKDLKEMREQLKISIQINNKQLYGQKNKLLLIIGVIIFAVVCLICVNIMFFLQIPQLNLFDPLDTFSNKINKQQIAKLNQNQIIKVQNSIHFESTKTNNTISIRYRQNFKWYAYLYPIGIEPGKIVQLTVKQVKTKERDIKYGVSTNKTLGIPYAYEHEQCISYWAWGYIYQNGNDRYVGPDVYDGSLVTLIADTIDWKIKWQIDGKQVAQANLSDKIKGETLYFTVFMHYKDNLIEIEQINDKQNDIL